MKTEINSVQIDKFIFEIGQVTPYRNTRGNIKMAEIKSIEKTDAKNPYWFRGIDTRTKANVWYSLHCSKDILNNSENR